MAVNPLAGYDMVMSITEASLNGIIKSKYGSIECPSSYEALLTSGTPWTINNGSWDNSKLQQETESNYEYAINTAGSNSNAITPPPTISIQDNTDILAGATVLLSIPFADGGVFCNKGKTYSLTGTTLNINVPITLNDITDQIESADSSQFPELQTVQSDLESNPFLLNELVLDLSSATSSDIDSSSVFNSDFPDDLQTPLFEVMQQLMKNRFILGFMPILDAPPNNTGLNDSQYAFRATSIQLSTTEPSTSFPSEGGMLNLCMLVGGADPLTESGSGLFKTSLYENIPTYSNNQQSSASGLMFFNPELFNYYMINPYLDNIANVFQQGHDDNGNGSWTGFDNFNYTPSYNSDSIDFSAAGQGVHGSKTYGKWGSEHFGFGVKFNYPKDPGSDTTPKEGDPQANATANLSSVINEDSTNLILSGTFDFIIEVNIEEEETALHEPSILQLTLSTDGNYQNSKYPEIPKGKQGSFSFNLGLNAPSNSGDTSIGELYMSSPESKDTVLGIESNSIVVGSSSLLGDMIKALFNVLSFGISGLLSTISNLINKNTGTDKLLQILVGNIGNVLETVFKDSANASNSLQLAPLIISDEINYSITDLNIITNNNDPAICCSVHYQTN